MPSWSSAIPGASPPVRVEEPPGEGSDVIEKSQHGLCFGPIDGPGSDEESDVCVNLFG